jgi:hypothetical protein
MRILFEIAIAASCALATTAPGRAGQEASDPRVVHWREDLALLAKELPARHKNLFFQCSKEEFEDAVAELDAAIPRLCDDEVVVELMRLVASVGDGHTTLQRGAATWNRLPVRLRKFSDGVHVVAIGRDHAEALGGRVVTIGGVAADEAWKRVAESVSHDNDSALDAYVPERLELPFVLHGLRLAADDRHASFEVESDAGKRIAVDLALATPPGDASGLLKTKPKEPAPLWQSRPSTSYWFEWVEPSKLLYLQYNECRDDMEHPFADLCAELFRCADQQDVERLVVDLRQNGGGSSSVIAPLYAGLGARRKLRERGRLFVAIGPSTFSSAMMNAVELKNGYGAILVGQPTGGKPNHYGEVRSFELPHSRLAVQYSTKHFVQVEGDPPSVEPDVAAPLSWSDWSSGRDPVLEAILAWKPAAPKKE